MEPHPLSSVDDLGTVYLGDDRVYRVISPGKEPQAQELLQSGLMERFYAEGLFPKTLVSEKSFPEANLVLEHEKIEPVSYPYEWSPEMLRAAARCALKVNTLANEFGYEIKDVHPYNVIFHGTIAKFVDFGSIVKKGPGPYWSAYNEFFQSYIYPLKLYRRGLTELFTHLHLLRGCSLPRAEFLIMNSSAFRLLGRRFTDLFCEYTSHYKNPLPKHDAALCKRVKQGLLLNLARLLYFSYRFPFRGVNLKKLEKTLNSIVFESSSESGSISGSYSFGRYSPDVNVVPGKQLNRVLEVVEELRPTSAIDLAGNTGELAHALSGISCIRKVICVFQDSRALDAWIKFGKISARISPMIFNIMGDSQESSIRSRTERLKSDLVLALGMTVPLLLSQEYNLGIVIDRITGFSRRHVLIEFAVGGKDEIDQAGSSADGYTEADFEHSLSKKCKIICRERMESDRILYLAKIS